MSNPSELALPFATSHAFIIGNNAYQHVSKLKTAVKDAKDIAQLLGGEHKYTIHALYDATKAEMEKMLTDMPGMVNENDRIVFYFAGHGIAFDSEKDPEGYLVPVDASSQDRKTLVSMNLLHNTLSEMKCKHGLLILDCCFAGSFKWSTGFRSLSFDETEEEMYEERFMRFVEHPAWQVITSAAHDQLALDLISHDTLGMREEVVAGEVPKGNNSPFAYALKQAIRLKGSAKQSRGHRDDGVITATELYTYVRRIVEEEAEKQNKGHKRQSPAIFTLSKHDTKGEFIFLEPGHRLNLPKAPDQNPYRGLGSFGWKQEDTRAFFGRRNAVEKMAHYLKQTPILIVSAPSGQGKSSTVMAGLFPLLKNDPLYPLDEILILRPGDHDAQKWNHLEKIDGSKPHLVLIDQYEEMFHEEEAEREKLERILTTLFQRISTAYHQDPNRSARLIVTIRSDFEWQLKVSSFGETFWDETQVLRFLYRLPPMDRDELREAMVKPAWMVAYEFESEELIGRILDEVQHAPGALPLLSFTLKKLYDLRDTGKRLFREKAYLKDLGGVNGALSNHADQVYLGLKNAEEKDFMRKLMLRMVRLNDGSYTRRKVYRTFESNRLEKALDELDYPDHQDPTVEAVLQVMEETQLIVIGRDEVGKYVEPVHDSLINFWPRCLEWIQTFGREILVLQRQLWQAVVEYHQLKEGLRIDPESELGNSPTPLWNNNPKLQEIQIAVTDPKNEWMVRRELADTSISSLSFLLWEEDPIDEQLQELEHWNWHFEEVDLKKRYQAVLVQMDNWLNEAEVAFVKESFERQQSELERAIAQRNEAIKARDLAEAKTREAEAIALTAVARNVPREQLTTRLKLVQEAYGKTLPTPPKPVISQTLANVCFDQFDRPGKPPVFLPTAYLDTGGIEITDSAISPDGQLIVTFSKDLKAILWSSSGEQIAELLTQPHRDDDHQWVKFGAVFSPDSQSLFTFFYREIRTSDHLADSFSLWNRKGERLKDLEILDDDHTYFSRGWNSLSDSSFSPDSQYLLLDLYGHVSNMPNSALVHTNPELTTKIKFPGEEEGYFGGKYFSPDSRYLIGLFARDSGEEPEVVARLWNIEGGEAIVLNPQTSNAKSVMFSPDGQFVWVHAENGDVKVWNLKGDLHADLGKSIEYPAPVFSADSLRVLTCPEEFMVRLWTREGEKEIEFKPDGRDSDHLSINGMKFSPNGQFFLTHYYDSEEQDRIIKVWDIQGNLKFGQEGDHVGALENLFFSPDSQYVLAILDNGLKIWDLNGEESANLERLAFRTRELESEYTKYPVFPFPDMEGFLTVFTSGVVRLMNYRGETLAVLDNHAPEVRFVRVAEQQQAILIHAMDGTVKVWCLPFEGRMATSFDSQLGQSINSVTISPDEKYVLTNTYRRDKRANLYTQAGQLVGGLETKTVNASFSPDGKYVLTIPWIGDEKDPDQAQLWTLDARLYSHLGKQVNTAMFMPDSEAVLTISSEGLATLWTPEGKKIQDLDTGVNHMIKIVFSPDGQHFISASTEEEGGVVTIWTKAGIRVRDLKADLRGLGTITISPDGKYILTSQDYGTCKLWTWEQDWEQVVSEGEYTGIFSSDHRFLFGYNDGMVELWNLSERKRVDFTDNLLMDEYGHKIEKGAMSVDNQTILLVVGEFGEEAATICNLTGEKLLDLDQTSVEVIEYSPDGELLVTVSWQIGEKSIAVLRDAQGKALTTMEQSTIRISDVIWAPDSNCFLTTYEEKLVKLWNRTGELIAEWKGVPDYRVNAAFTPDSQSVLVWQQDVLRTWPVPKRMYQYLEETFLPELTGEEREDLGVE